ncbi:MAG: glycosyltransferase [Patescibacteria group bacterium]|nr:MAG: glycosyltransferase [Patescibacteria group bacterium]
MKILIATGIYPPDIGGPATYSKLLKDDLPKRGIGVSVVSFGDVRHLPKIIRHIAYFFMVLGKAKGADVIFAQDPVSVGLPAMLATKILRKKFVLKVVGDYAWEQFQIKNKELVTPDAFQHITLDLITELRRKIERMVARRADRVIVPSKYLKGIVKKWGVRNERLTVIYNSFKKPDTALSQEEVRAELGIDADAKIILSAGRLVPWKGFGTLVGMMPSLKKANPNINLFIIGEGPDKHKLINDSSSDPSVHLLGALPQQTLYRYIIAADVFVLNTAYEGLSHQLLEVLALGTPIVTTHVGGNPEVISDGVNGILVEHNDTSALEESIQKILNNEAFAAQLSENGKDTPPHFEKDVMLYNLEKELNQVCKS